MVTDNRLASYTRFMHDIESRVLKGSLPANKVMDTLRPLIGQEVPKSGSVIKIDRSKPLDLALLLSEPKGWRVLEQDERSLAITELKLDDVEMMDMLEDCDGKDGITADEKLKRLKEDGHIRLDALILQTLMEYKRAIPSHWRKRAGDSKESPYISFDGTVLINDETGTRLTPAFTWDEEEGWMICAVEFDPDETLREYDLSATLLAA